MADTPPPESFDELTEDERCYLAMQARYRSESFNDPRYHRDLDHTERAAGWSRWRQIADALHPDPWKEGNR